MGQSTRHRSKLATRVGQEVIPFFAFPTAVRKIHLPRQNAIESLNRVIRKTTKTRGSISH